MSYDIGCTEGGGRVSTVVRHILEIVDRLHKCRNLLGKSIHSFAHNRDGSKRRQDLIVHGIQQSRDEAVNAGRYNT